MLVLGVGVWLHNLYSIITGLRQMALWDGVTAGIIFIFGPRLIWESAARVSKGWRSAEASRVRVQ